MGSKTDATQRLSLHFTRLTGIWEKAKDDTPVSALPNCFCSTWCFLLTLDKKHNLARLYPEFVVYTCALAGPPRGHSGKESACQCRRYRRPGFNPSIGKIPWRRKWQPTPAFLPGKSHGQRTLAGYSPWGHKTRQDLATKQQQQYNL